MPLQIARGAGGEYFVTRPMPSQFLTRYQALPGGVEAHDTCRDVNGLPGRDSGEVQSMVRRGMSLVGGFTEATGQRQGSRKYQIA